MENFIKIIETHEKKNFQDIYCFAVYNFKP